MPTLIRCLWFIRRLWFIALMLVVLGCSPSKTQPSPVAPAPSPAEPAKAPTIETSSNQATPPGAAPAAASPAEPTEGGSVEKDPSHTSDSALGADTGDEPSGGEPMLANSKSVSAVPETWTSQNLVLMGKGGPRFIKLNINASGQDFEHGFQESAAKIAQELSLDFNQPIEWTALLDKPLIASGWLGNLVPNAEQRVQLVGLYDTNKDEKVDEAEFRSFLTRGLTRIPHLKIVSRPSTAPRFPTDSPWGPLDIDADGDLNADELKEAVQTMLRFDFDGDRIMTPGELRSASDSEMNPMTPRSGTLMLDLTPVHIWDIAKPEAMARAVLENYSFGASMSRDLLFAWQAERIKQVDVNEDGTIELEEMHNVVEKDIEGEFRFRFPKKVDASSETLSVSFQSIDPKIGQSWIGHPDGGRLTLDGCIVTIVLNDEQNAGVHEAFKAQLGRIEKDAQLKAFAMQALELKEGAIEVLQSTAESQHVDPGELAWRWLVEPRHWHVQIGWSASESPWFELMDLNGDQKLVFGELEQFAAQAKSWDRNKDGIIKGEEMPVSVLLEVKRPEARGLKSRLGGTAVEKRGANVGSAPTWFTGMDYNSDGELSQSEFLGERSDFEKLDKNRDGIIEVREVTTPQ